MAGKIKALQIWCKNRLVGYKDVEITNMTTSWRDGLAFCALIHRFRPDLIDFESLSKENVFENNQLAFEVAEELGIPALLDAEDMVRLEVPDKLSIITYVAQIHNCFKDELPVSGPDTKTASKRHSTPVQRSVTMRSPDTKRRPTLQARKKSDSHGALLSGADICVVCDGKVYLIEKHIADGKLYHRSCFKTNNRKSEANALKPSSQTPDRSTAGRPSSLASSGLKKTPASLPSTPSTPPDTRPEWQKRLQEKSLVKKAAANASAAHGSPHSSLETLREDQNATESKTKSVFETEKVKLRSRPAGNRAAAPRAVSVGVDLDERLSKLRQLRESAKASGGTSEAVKNRLERLQKVAAKGSSSNTTRDKTSSGSGDQSCDKVEPATVSEQVLDTMETDSPSSTHSNTDLSEEMVTSEEATSTKDSVGDVEKDGAKEDESPHKQSTNPFECDESDNEVGRSSPVPQQPSNDNLQNKSEQVKTAEVEEKKQADTVSELSGAIQPIAEKSTPPVRPQRRSQKVKAATANSPSAKSASPKATPVIKEEETPASPTALPLSSLNIAVSTPLRSSTDTISAKTSDSPPEKVHSDVTPVKKSSTGSNSRTESDRKVSDGQSEAPESSDVKTQRKTKKMDDLKRDEARSAQKTPDSPAKASPSSDAKLQQKDRKMANAAETSQVESTKKTSGSKTKEPESKSQQKSTKKMDDSTKKSGETVRKSSSSGGDNVKKSGNPSGQSSVDKSTDGSSKSREPSKPISREKTPSEISKRSPDVPKESAEVSKRRSEVLKKSSGVSRNSANVTKQSPMASEPPSKSPKRSSAVPEESIETAKGNLVDGKTTRKSSEVTKPSSAVAEPTKEAAKVSAEVAKSNKSTAKQESTSSKSSVSTSKHTPDLPGKSTTKPAEKSAQMTDDNRKTRVNNNNIVEKASSSSERKNTSSVEATKPADNDKLAKTSGSPTKVAVDNVIQPANKMASEKKVSRRPESAEALKYEANEGKVQNTMLTDDTHGALVSHHTEDAKSKHRVKVDAQPKNVDKSVDCAGTKVESAAMTKVATSGSAASVDMAAVVQEAVAAKKTQAVKTKESTKVSSAEKVTSSPGDSSVKKSSVLEKAATSSKIPAEKKSTTTSEQQNSANASTVENSASSPRVSTVEKAPTVEKAISTPKAPTVEKATSTPKASTVEKAPTVEKATSAPKASTVEKVPAVEKATSTPKASTVEKAPAVEKATSAPKTSTVEKSVSRPQVPTVERAISASKTSTLEHPTSTPKASTAQKTTSVPKSSAVEKASIVEKTPTVDSAAVHVGEKSNTKPPRPPVSPVGGRKEPSTPPQVKDKSNDNSSKAVHLQVPAGAPSVKSSNGIESPVAMRRQPDSRKTPPRPKTVAAGSASKSHFYLDEEHKKVLEPPPKPARQAVGKGSGWEDALEKWSVKRKNDTNRSTWYTTESYPTEHNPFGDDDEDNTGESKTDSEKLTQITSKSDGKKSEYDTSLNPFADDNAADTDVSESINKPVKPVKQKLMPLNPFEFSDDEDEEEKIVDNRKKLMPDDLAVDKKTKRSPQPKRGQIILPDAHVKKATPKKKLAPPAPQTPPTQSTPDVQSKLSENKENTQTQHSRRKTNENTPQGKGNSKLDDIDEDSALSIDMQKKKHKPAPPRPMPPKRRPQSDYGVDPDNISQELKAIERKQVQLEEKGRQLEQAIRNADETLGSQEMNNDDDEDLLTSWLETVNEKNHLVRRESELIFISQHHALETKQADIEWQLREIMHRAENLKTDDDKLREESLLQQLVSLVTERSKLVDKMDDERLRQQDEDRKINMMLGSTAKSSVDNSKSANKKGGASAEKKGKKKDKKIK